MAALSVGAGRLGGGQDVLAAMQRWALLPPLGTGLSASDWLRFWREATTARGELAAGRSPGWLYPNGRGPHGVVAQALAGLADRLVYAEADVAGGAPGGPRIRHGREPDDVRRRCCGGLCDLGLTPVQGEMLFLLLRIAGCCCALEQQESNYQAFRSSLELLDDPARGGA